MVSKAGGKKANLQIGYLSLDNKSPEMQFGIEKKIYIWVKRNELSCFGVIRG